MVTIHADALTQMPLENVAQVTFYKRDKMTTDLICCEVCVDGKRWTFHEELAGWDLLVQHLAALPGFDADWFASLPVKRFVTRVAQGPLH